MAKASATSMAVLPIQRRLQAIDVMRGLVMVLMAIDHVRVFSGVPAGGPTLGVFFTRWITHFCAPAFAFFAGTAAFLHGRRLADTSALARYLVTRGLVLILLELTFIRVAWTFNLDFAHYLLAGVIWMLGACMILLAALVRLPFSAVAAIGIAITVGHNLIDPWVPRLIEASEASATPWLWPILYLGPMAGGEGPFVVLYSLIPWIGVMAIGYAFGHIMTVDPQQRRRVCLTLGLGAMVAFVVLRASRIYGDPRAWNGTDVLGFLNTTKYPASLQFLLMTLGPMIALLPAAERWRGRVTETLAVFGRVPLFYYLLHIPLIHSAAIVVSLIRSGHVDPWLFANHPMRSPTPPEGYVWGLPLLYLVFAMVIVVLYLPCRWFAQMKATREERWLRYL